MPRLTGTDELHEGRERGSAKPTLWSTVADGVSEIPDRLEPLLLGPQELTKRPCRREHRREPGVTLWA